MGNELKTKIKYQIKIGKENFQLKLKNARILHSNIRVERFRVVKLLKP